VEYIWLGHAGLSQVLMVFRRIACACRDERLDREVEYVPELAAVWRGVEAPPNPDELERELGKAGLAAAPRATDRKRTALPPKVRSYLKPYKRRPAPPTASAPRCRQRCAKTRVSVHYWIIDGSRVVYES
jgi:hypothetical protein